MKNIYLLLFLFCCFCPSPADAQDAEQNILFNSGWKFMKGDAAGAERPAYNDQNWRAVSLPHDWSIEGPFDEKWASSTGYLPGGIAWYRKTFTLKPAAPGEKTFIYFDGVYKNSEVWINGHYLGKRPNGYVSFQYELSKYLNKTGSNTLAVKVDHTKFADSRWYPGSGIYRNVYLIVKNPVYIPTWGIAFSTPQVTTEKVSAALAVDITNSSSQPAVIVVKSSLVDKQGKVAASASEQLKLGASSRGVAQLSFAVLQPELWSVDDPSLYQLKVSLVLNGKTVDQQQQQVGLREIRYTANEGFFLNGKNMKMKGVCIHHDAGALGAAVPAGVWAWRLRKLKAAGVNAIRMSHYPHQDYLYKLCDQMGFLVMDEAFDEWEYGKNKWVAGWNKGKPTRDGYNEYFKEWAESDLKDVVLRNRNHPSIVMWSIGNEIDYPNDPYSHEVLNTGRNPQIYGRGYSAASPPASEMGPIARRLVKVVKDNDTTRPVTAALAGVVMSNLTDYPGLLDLVGYNYQEYRYAEDHKQYPDRIIYGSENGKGRKEWLAVDSNKYIFGQFLWTGFDFVGEAHGWPLRSSGAGLLDMAGFPKNDFYLRQALWTTKPMAYLMVSKSNEDDEIRFIWNSAPSWNWKEAEQLKVLGITNTEEAELFLNGKSLGRKKAGNSGTPLFWNLNYQPGELTMKGYAGGREVVSYQLTTSAEAKQITATLDRERFAGDVQEVAMIELSLKDKDGNLVYAADNPVEVKVEGPAKLLGLESGDLASHESYQSNVRKAYHGKLLAYIQTNAKAGTVKVTIIPQGMASKTITYTLK
ncbi:MAG: sugar-binding domain-containing protein [Pedobacter sp.]|uniref:sugar-binding domain-containing protein n=1 Tax=Pedobacter sp. TaxID=1411316 RepID=UPI00339B79F2